MMPAGESPSRSTDGRISSIPAASRVRSAGVQIGTSVVDLCIRNQRARIGIGENMRDFPVAIKDVDRHKDHAEFHARQIDVDHLDAIHEINAEPVAFAQPSFHQEARKTITARIEFSERVRLVAELECDGIAASFERQVEQIARES